VSIDTADIARHTGDDDVRRAGKEVQHARRIFRVARLAEQHVA